MSLLSLDAIGLLPQWMLRVSLKCNFQSRCPLTTGTFHMFAIVQCQSMHGISDLTSLLRNSNTSALLHHYPTLSTLTAQQIWHAFAPHHRTKGIDDHLRFISGTNCSACSGQKDSMAETLEMIPMGPICDREAFAA